MDTNPMTSEDRHRRERTGPRPRWSGEGRMARVVLGLARRWRFVRLVRHHDRTAVLGVFAFVNGCISIAVMTVAAWVTGQPFVFPSLGPTAFLLFHAPLAPSSCPRNTIAGHAIGVAAGWLSLLVFGLLDAGPATTAPVEVTRIGAAALSLGGTAGFMVWLGVPHPPAAATTMIISLGILTSFDELGVLLLAVVLLTVQGLVINRLAGFDYPLWGPLDTD